MIRRSTWILIGLMVVAVAGTIVWSRQPAAPPADQTPTPEALWDVDSATIQSIRVEDLQGGSVVEVERNPEEAWHMAQPTPGPADAARVERSATWLALPRPRSVLPRPEDLAAFGLDQPAKKITVTFQDATQQELLIGRSDPTGSVVYAQVLGGTDVLLISKFGLDEVLGLLDPIPVATPTATATAASTAAPAAGGATPEPTIAY